MLTLAKGFADSRFAALQPAQQFLLGGLEVFRIGVGEVGSQVAEVGVDAEQVDALDTVVAAVGHDPAKGAVGGAPHQLDAAARFKKAQRFGVGEKGVYFRRRKPLRHLVEPDHLAAPERSLRPRKRLAADAAARFDHLPRHGVEQGIEQERQNEGDGEHHRDKGDDGENPTGAFAGREAAGLGVADEAFAAAGGRRV